MRAATVGFDTRVRDAWDDHHARLWRALLVWSGSREVASDACAEAFAQVLRRGEAVEDVGAWVWRAAFRIAGGLLSERRHEELGESALPGTDGADVAALSGALAQLSEDDRTVVVLCLIGGWPADAVAGMTASTAGAVRVRLHRARARLRDLLEVHDA